MACEDGSKAVPQRRPAASGWLVTVADDNGVATPSDEMQCRCASADRLVHLANGMVPTWAPLERPFPSLGSCAVPQHVVGVNTTVCMVTTLQKAFFEEPSNRGVLLRGVPGSGKSTFSRAYVASHEGSYPGGAIWLTGNTVAAITNRIGHQMRRFSHPASAEEVVPWFRDWLGRQPGRWLVVVDDVDNGSGIHGVGDTAADSLLEWLGDLWPGRSLGGGHELVTTRGARLSGWAESLTVVFTPPLTRDQAVLVLWRYIRRRAQVAPRDSDKGYLSLPHADGITAELTSDPLRHDRVPAGVLDPDMLVEWDRIPELVAELWAWDCGEQRRDEEISTFIQRLAPGLPDLASMAQSQRITLLQWYTRLLMVRPGVKVDQHVQQLQDLQRSPKQRSLGRKLYAWACLEASDAAGNPIHAWASARIELFKAVQQTVRRLCGVSYDDTLHVRGSRQHASQQRRNSGDPCADTPLEELLPLFRHDPVEYVALCTLPGKVLTSPGSGGRPAVLPVAADAVVASGSCIASFLPSYERDQHLVASGPGVGTGVGASVGAGASAGGEIPERVAALWQHGHDGNRQQEIAQDLVPGSSSDPVATQESHNFTLLQWFTLLLLLRPKVSADQHRQRVKAVARCIASQLHRGSRAWLPAPEATGTPPTPWMALYHRLRRVIGATVRLLSRSHSFLSKGKPTQLSVLRQRGPYEYGAVCDMVGRFVSPAGTTHDSFTPGVLGTAANAVMRAVANVAAFLPAAGERGAGLHAGHLASDGTVPDGHTGHGDGAAEREENVAAGRAQVAAQGSDQGGEPTTNTDTDGEEEDGVDNNVDGDDNSIDDSNRFVGDAASDGGGDGAESSHVTGRSDHDNTRGRNGCQSQGDYYNIAYARVGDAGGCAAAVSDDGSADHSEALLITGPTWPPRGMRIVALHGQRVDGMATLAAEFAAAAAPQYVGGVFVLDGQSTTAMWKGIRGVVLAKALCSGNEGAALDDMAVCNLFLRWLADVRPLCLFVVTNACVVEDAGIDSSDDSAASRCGALLWLLSRLRNTSNLHVLFTTTATRATTASVAPVVATISLGSSGDYHAVAVMKLLASAYSLPMGPFSSSPYPAKSAGCPSCPNCGLELDAHNMEERGLSATGAQLHGDSAANSATVKPCQCQDQSQREAAHAARILH